MKSFHLVCGEIVFVNTVEEQVGSTRMNAILVTDTENVTAKDLGEAQKNLQINYLKAIENNDQIKILDVVLIHLSPLGVQSKKDFYGEEVK